ncbi:MAG: SpoIID/LytB domain-containing protein [Merdibacter sp.]
MVTLERDGEHGIELEEYLKGVVGSEMTPSYEMEALKAQAVAARTFVASRNYRVDDRPLRRSISMTPAAGRWKEDYEESQQRVAAAVDATREIMVVDGEPITAFFLPPAAERPQTAKIITAESSPICAAWSRPGMQRWTVIM